MKKLGASRLEFLGMYYPFYISEYMWKKWHHLQLKLIVKLF